jgi:hypothetical protein
MSGYFVKRPQENLGSGNEDFASLAGEFPAIAWALAGRPKDHPEGQEYPATLMIFFDSGRLKYCLAPKIGLGVAFGTIKDPSKLLDSIEASLRQGDYEWKTRRRQ